MVKRVNTKEITLLGGDARMAWLAVRLQERGYRVRLAALVPPPELQNSLPKTEAADAVLQEAQTVVFAIPTYDKEGYLRTPSVPEKYTWGGCISRLAAGTLVFAGDITPEMQKIAECYQIRTVDLLNRPELAELSAIATAEGAVAIAMKEMSATLFGAECMVVGYGRCGSALARRLGALGAKVIATARRKEQLARIYADGFTPWPTERLLEKLPGCEVVFNTVPAPVLGQAELERLDRGAVVIDLASEPGGIDRTAAESLGVPWIQALGLPGKVAPRTAGEHLQQVICDLLEEKEDTI